MTSSKVFSLDWIKGHKDRNISLLIGVFVIIKLLSLHYYKIIWWDPSVYIGMGKYIFSLGKLGLWEEARPLVWPLMLGFLWKLGLNQVLFARILDVIFGALVILFTYKIGEKIFDAKTALLACAFIATSPTFFFFDGIMLSEVVSTFFALVAINFLLTKKFYLAGIFFGVSFMTRFLQLYIFIGVLLVFCSYRLKYKDIAIKVILGFGLAVFPYLFLNFILYHNPLLPFTQQIFLTKNTGWPNYHGIDYYFKNLFKENILYLFSLIGAFLSLKSEDKNKRFISAFFLIAFIFFNSIRQKEMRFLIILFPYMFLLLSFAVKSILEVRGGTNWALQILVITSIILSCLNIAYYYKLESGKENTYDILQSKFDKANGNLWVFSPIVAVYSNNKINNLMYYPLFNEGKKNELIDNLNSADHLFIDTCEIACNPNDIGCEAAKAELLEYVVKKLKVSYMSKNNQCTYLILDK